MTFLPTFTRRGAAVVLVAAATAALTSCSARSTAESASSASSLSIASDLTYPPYDFMDGDTPAGFDVELWKELGPKIGVTPTFEDTRFENLISGLKSGNSEVISSALYITAERAEQVDYIPYFSTGNSIISPEGSSYDSIEDLCGLTVGVLKGSDISNKLTTDASAQCTDAGKSAIDVRDFATDPEATQALLSGQAEAQVTDAAVAAIIVEKRDTLTITSSELLYPVPVGMAVVKGNTELADKITKGLNELKADGSYATLLKKYNLSEPVAADVDAALNPSS